MTAGRRHEVTGVTHEEGRLSFDARIGDRRERVWLKTDGDAPTSAEAVLPISLLPAMRFGGTLEVPVPISPRMLRNQREYQRIQRIWSLDSDHLAKPLQEVDVIAPEADLERTEGDDRVATLFSGGVDSWSTLLDHPEVTDLIFVRGLDLLLSAPHQEPLIDEVEARIRDVAHELELSLHVVETNLRDFSDPIIPWEVYYGSVEATIALFLAPRFDRVLIANGFDYEVYEPEGVSYLVDHFWSTEGLEIVEDGGRYNRVERLARIASHPLVQKTLRVCWRNPDGAYNCGHCRKCLQTMVTLEALGARDSISTFPRALDLEAIGDIEVSRLLYLLLWEDVLDAVRSAGRADLEPPVEAVVAGGKRRLGLPPAYRRRSLPGPPALSRDADPTPARGSPPLEVINGEARGRLGGVLESRSWRLTAPLRRLGVRAGLGRR